MFFGLDTQASNLHLDIAYASDKSGEFEIYLVDQHGTSEIQLTRPPLSGGGYLAWSPSGEHLAFYRKSEDGKTWSIYSISKDGGNWKRLTHQEGVWDHSPSWSPDNKHIVFGRTYRNLESGEIKNEIWLMGINGGNPSRIEGVSGGGPFFTPDGRIVFHSQIEDEDSEVTIVDKDGKNLTNLTNSNGDDLQPEVSPDGTQIAFSSNRDGDFEIYVMNIDGSSQRRLTFSPARDSMPSWSPDSKSLIFTSNRDGRRAVYAIDISDSQTHRIVSRGSQPAWYKPLRVN